jgi:hypothetical protein
MTLADKLTANVLWQPALTRWSSLSLGLVFFALAGVAPIVAYGQLELVTNKEAQCVFAGDTRNISVMFHNPGGQGFNDEIRARIFQTSSATAAQLSEAPWKKLQVLPGQTVLESAQLGFPSVAENGMQDSRSFHASGAYLPHRTKGRWRCNYQPAACVRRS